jgi:hypothetical protein
MARLRFIHGAIRGKLGEFVGSSWKGINYIKTFSKPSNPRTDGQISVRQVFTFISNWACALFEIGLNNIIPPVKRMTARNSVFKANGKMITEKLFKAADLQIALANFAPVASVAIGRSTNTDTFSISAEIIVNPSANIGNNVIHLLAYNTIAQKIIGYQSMPLVAGTDIYSADFDKPVGFLPANTQCFAFFTATDEKGKKYLSKTFSNS